MIQISDHSLALVAEKFGTGVESLAYVGGGREESDGILYSYRSGSREMVLKILAFSKQEAGKALQEMDERAQFINYLGTQGMDIAYPIVNPNQKILETLEAGDHILAAYAMDRIQGEVPAGEALSSDFYNRYGKMIGKLHRLTKGYSKWLGNVPGGDSEVLNWRGEWQFFHGWCKDEEIKQAWVKVKEELDSLPVTRDTFGFIHNDPHIHNVMLEQDRIILIDFDVANFHWFMNDIAIASQFLMFSTAGGMGEPFKDLDALKSFYHNFMEGYETENHLEAAVLDRLDLFIDYRRLLMYTISQQWLESNPEQHESWKRMILTSPRLPIFSA